MINEQIKNLYKQMKEVRKLTQGLCKRATNVNDVVSNVEEKFKISKGTFPKEMKTLKKNHKNVLEIK